MRRGFTKLIVLLAVLFAGSIASPAAFPAFAAPGSTGRTLVSTDISASSYSPVSEECEMLSRINAYRKSRGLNTVKLSATLSAAARHHSVEMAKYDYFSHTMRNGVSWSQNILNHGYPSSAYRAEIIAAGNGGSWATLNQWKNSSAHNDIILTGSYKAIGIGRAYGANARYGYYWTATFGSSTSQTISC